MKILIVRIGALGDVLHALPAVAALRAARPDWKIDWAVDTRWLPLLDDPTGPGPVINAALPVPIHTWKQSPFSPRTIRDFLSFQRFRRHHYDLVVDMQGTLRSAALGRLAGGRTLAGYADPRESPAAALYRTRIPRRGVHVVEQGAALLSDALHLNITPTTPALPRDPAAELWAEHTIPARPLALLCPGGGWAAKQWPAEHFSQLAIRLRDRGYHVLVNASSPADTLALRVAAASRGAASIQPCSVAQLVALMRRTDLLIGHDSGPTHLAALLAVPLVALFGPTDPARNGPWGPGPKQILRHAASATSYKHTATPDPALARITVEQVLSAVQRLQRRQSVDIP